MNHLNYFHPYEAKLGHHEDQLTRVYLVVLKHSSNAFFTFMEYCRACHKISAVEPPVSPIDFLEDGWQIETQKGNPKITTERLVSVLITDTKIKAENSSIRSSGRNARYDGVITFGSKLTMVIENKPRSTNVRLDQLKPSKLNLSRDTVLYRSPIVLEWKTIIKQLSHLLDLPTVSGTEKMIIEDFLSFIDERFPFLNPFDHLHLCKGNEELLRRRICNLLTSITRDQNLVKENRRW